MKLFQNRALRQGSAATAITVLAIALLVVINMIFTVLSGRYNLKLDLTEGQIFTLSDESKEFLKTIEKDVTVTILAGEDSFASQGAYFEQAGEVIKRYANENSHINVVFEDIVKDPTLVARYPDLTMSPGNILVECGDRQVVLTAYELFNTEVDYTTYQTAITSSKAEQALSSAILNVTSDKRITVSVLSGHNEYPVEEFAALLRTNNYDIIEQNLMSEEINPEATVAVLCAPARDITEAEAVKLDRFLSNGDRLGKTLFYMANAVQPATMPVLDAFLEEWGIAVRTGNVYETNAANIFDMNYFSTLADYIDADGTYSQDFVSRDMRIAVPNSRPIEYLFENRGIYETKPLLTFSETSGVRPLSEEEEWSIESAEPSGPVAAMGMSQTLKYDGTTPLVSTVIVSGSDTIIDGYLIGSRSLANSEYILGLIGDLAGRDDTVVIQDKTIGIQQLGVTWGQVWPLGIAFAVVVPLCVLAAGISVWVVRRRK